MAGLLIKLFIKDNGNVHDPKVRQAYGMLSGLVGIACNLLLVAVKFAAGFLAGSVSVCADAFNNLSDAGSSIITFIGFKMAGRPADIDHPFGHGRIEYISGLAVSTAIVVMGVELFESSIVRILHPEAVKPDILTFLILAGSILVKMWMAAFNRALGRKIDSAAMRATAADSISDCLSTAVVLVSMAACALTGVNIDGYAGLIVAAFVFFTGIDAAKETLQPLLGQQADEELVRGIESLVMQDTHIIGIHDLIVHDYGPGRVFASLHAEIPYTIGILEAHEVIDSAEQRIHDELGCSISIHMDPVVTDDKQAEDLKKAAQEAIEAIDPVLEMHDFRVARRPDGDSLIFDVVAPFGFPLSDEALKQQISEEIAKRKRGYKVQVQVDKAALKFQKH